MKKENAIIIGSSIAGLLAARVCADHFDQVIILEKDKISPEPAHRKGVPQDHQVHVLLSKGYEVIRQLFPGIIERLQDRGGITGDLGLLLKWYSQGGYRPQCETGLHTVMTSRPLLENTLRQMLLEKKQVSLIDQARITGLLHEGNTVVGVQTEEGKYYSNLLIDTRGIGSRLAPELEKMGYSAPEVEKVQVNVTYTSCVFPRATDFYNVININSNPPHNSKSGTIQPIEDGKMIVIVNGRSRDAAPKDLSSFKEYTQALDSPLVYQHIRDLEPVSGLFTYRIPYVRWIHFERLSAFPEGILPLGDAICRLNPVYGQGMSSAAIQAEILDKMLRKRETEPIWKPFFHEVAREIKTPWELTVAEDFKFPETEGVPPKTPALLAKYFTKLNRVMNGEPVIYKAFARVLNMVSPPTVLFYPNIVWRVIKAR
ncbi:MAG: hypothetical protein RIG62_11970 [Cyclobacteriaceae bacterium]